MKSAENLWLSAFFVGLSWIKTGEESQIKFMDKAAEILREFATQGVLVRRDFKMGKRGGTVLFHPDITDAEIIRSVLYAVEQTAERGVRLDTLLESTVFASEAKVVEDKSEAVAAVLAGDMVLVLDGEKDYLVVNARKWDKRAVAEPPTQTVLRGPREGFIEDIKTNLSLLSRRLKSPAFAVERMNIGRLSATSVAICYLSTVADPALIKKVRERLRRVDIDALTDSHYLQPHLENSPHSIFHQTGVSEKPDIVAAKMLEGRVAIIVDGSPMVITVPFILIEDFQSSEDYYERNEFSTFLRILRYISILVGVLIPGLYVSIQVYHYNIIPIRFLITIMNAVKGIPLPPLPEMLFVLMLFEIIRESSVRMPRAVGMAMSIVGALVLGDTAVKAGMISSPAVMITALSSIALYTVPNQVGTMTLVRLAFTVLGGLAGLLGLLVGALFTVHYLSSLDSLGTPYLAPLAPIVLPDLKDSLIRRPLTELKKRPKSIPNINPTRQG